MEIHAWEAACRVAASEPLIFPQPVTMYKKHSSGVLQSLQVSEQGRKPQFFDTPLWLPSSPLPFSPVPYAPQEFLPSGCLNTSMQPEWEMRTRGLGWAGRHPLRAKGSRELDWLCSSFKSSLPTPLLLVPHFSQSSPC